MTGSRPQSIWSGKRRSQGGRGYREGDSQEWSRASRGWSARRTRTNDRDRGPVHLSEMFDGLLKRLKKPPTDVLGVVFNRWESVVGPDVARHCRPVAVDAKRLIVEADEPIWADQLKWQSETVLDRIAEKSGDRQLEELTVKVAYHRSAAGVRRSGERR